MSDQDGAPAPFDGYDDLTAAEVVDRLGTLSPAEVDAVKAYEADHQNRKTIADFTPASDADEGAGLAEALGAQPDGPDPVGTEDRETFDPEAEEQVSGWDPPEGRPALGDQAEDLAKAYDTAVHPQEG